MGTSGIVDLTVTEPGGTDRTNFPLTVGVPFAKGKLSPDEPVAIMDEQAGAQPLQSKVLETHDDGSIRWLLLDYQSDFESLRTRRHTLVQGERSSESLDADRIRTSKQGDLLVVDNGPLKLELDTVCCRPLVRVWHRGTLVSDGPLDFRITADDGNRYHVLNDSDVSFQFEESGDLRILVGWEGTHKDTEGKGHFDFLVRLTVYAGNPFVRVEHVFFNRLDPEVTHIKELAAHLPIQVGNDPAYCVGDQYRSPRKFDTEQPVYLEMHEFRRFRIIDRDGGVLREEDNASMGWVSVSGNDHGVMLAGKNFYQNFPKAIAADEQGLDCYLIPERGTGFDVPIGMAKSHTFFLHFHDGRSEQQDFRDMAFTMQRWPMPTAPSEYYLNSGECWDYFPQVPGKYQRIEAAFRRMFEPDPYHNPRPPGPARAYGLKHFGDFLLRPSPSGDRDADDAYYLNNEYDTPHVLIMLFLRNRQITKWWGAEAHAQHMMDVDTRHHTIPIDPHEYLYAWKCLIDCQYRHCYQHIGGIQEVNDSRILPAGGSHTFAQGLLDYHHLTGDRRALDTAWRYAKHLAYCVNEEGYLSGIGRITGWGMLVMAGVYMARPDEDIHRACDALIDTVIAQQLPDGSILECNQHPRAVEDRKIHLGMRGLIKWHQASGCEKTKKLILELMEGYLNSGLLDEGLPLYSNWPEESMPTTSMQGFANLESLAYAYDLTGDRRYVDAGIPGLCQAIEWILEPEEEELRTNFQRGLRGPLRFMAIAHNLGILEKVPGAGGWLNS